MEEQPSGRDPSRRVLTAGARSGGDGEGAVAPVGPRRRRWPLLVLGVAVVGTVVVGAGATVVEVPADATGRDRGALEISSVLAPSRVVVVRAPDAGTPGSVAPLGSVGLKERRAGTTDTRATSFLAGRSQVDGGPTLGLAARSGEVRVVDVVDGLCAADGADVVVTGVHALSTAGDVDVLGAVVGTAGRGDADGWERVDRLPVTDRCGSAGRSPSALGALVALRGDAGAVCGFVVRYTEDGRERAHLAPTEAVLRADPSSDAAVAACR